MTEKIFLEFVFFKDRDRRHRDDGEFNKAGYLSDGFNIIHLQGNRLVKTKLEKLQRYSPQILKMPLDIEVANAAHEWLTREPLDPRHFGYGMNALMSMDWRYFTHPAPPLPPPATTSQEHFARWEIFWSLAQAADMVCTFDSQSRMSRLISWVDRGPWSHTAMYSGEGTIIEATTAGGVERSVDVYNNIKIRLGLYRSRGVNAQQAVKNMRTILGSGYNYSGALRAGVGKYFNLYNRGAGTPNDLIKVPGLQHIAYV